MTQRVILAVVVLAVLVAASHPVFYSVGVVFSLPFGHWFGFEVAPHLGFFLDVD